MTAWNQGREAASADGERLSDMGGVLSTTCLLAARNLGGGDFQDARPGGAQARRKIELGELPSNLFAAGEDPDVFPVRVAQEVGDRPGLTIRGALAQQASEVLGSHRLVGEEIEIRAALGSRRICAGSGHTVISIATEFRNATLDALPELL